MSLIWNLLQMKQDIVNGWRKSLVDQYPDGITDDLIMEMRHLPTVHRANIGDNQLSALELLNCLRKYKLQGLFPNVCVCLRILLTIPVTVASTERSFSKLKQVKHFFRSTMAQGRLVDLARLNIEAELAMKVYFYEVYFVMPVIVVVVITALLITPFLEEPKIEFILAVSFFLLCCICYLPFQYLKNKQFFSADKLTIYLQLFLRIVPRNALKNKARIFAEKRNYNRRMSTPETRGYLHYHSQEWSDDSFESNNDDNVRKRNMFQPNDDSSVEKSLKSVLKKGFGIPEHNSESCDDSNSDDVDYELPSTDDVVTSNDDEHSEQTKSKMSEKL